MSSSTSYPIRFFAAIAALAIVFASATALGAHDFWLVPDAFAVAGDADLRVSGHSGTRFGTSQGATQPARVIDARVIGANGEMKITEMEVQGTALRLRQRPSEAGQYLVTLALQPRTSRSTPQGLLRYLRAEGAAGEAMRLERANLLTGDTISYRSSKFATTVVQVGRGGARAFARTSGHPLQFVPLTDPGHALVGDTLHVRITMDGLPLRNTAVHAGPAVDTTVQDSTGRPVDTTIHLATDATGMVHVPLSKSGAWNLRTAAVAARRDSGGAAWDIAWATYVFGVSPRR